MRPQREDYVRVSVQCEGFTLEPAIEFRAHDSYCGLLDKLEYIARLVVFQQKSIGGRKPTPMQVAQAVAAEMAKEWPDRAYFIEAWQDGAEGFAQVFQPYGVPRNPVGGMSW